MKGRITKYDGPDGAKRIELLEELAKVIMRWTRECWNWPEVNRLCAVLAADNERVAKQTSTDRQREVFDEVGADFTVPLSGLADTGKSDDPIDK